MTSRAVPVGLLAVTLVTLAAGGAHAQPFEDITAATGLPTLKRPVTPSSQAAAASFCDVDGDGDRDLVSTGPGGPPTLYLRGPDGRFALSPNALPVALGETLGNTLFDMDRDGDCDLLILRASTPVLFENVHGSFVDVTRGRLPVTFGASMSAMPIDIDGDGDLDVYVARYVDRQELYWSRGLTNQLFDNDGHGVFRDITAEAGLTGAQATLVTLGADIDQDGDLDLIDVDDFGQYTGGNRIWRNDGGSNATSAVHFSDVTEALGWDVRAYGMGIALGDPDEDGALDALVTNIGEVEIRRQDPTGVFRHLPAGIGPRLGFGQSKRLVTWTAAFEDIDGDGTLDLLIAAGRLDAEGFLANRDQVPLVLSGLGAHGADQVGPRFVEPAPADGLTSAPAPTRDVVLEDLDGDGHPELVVVNLDRSFSVHRSLARGLPATFIALAPRYASSAAGARVVVRCGATQLTRYVLAGGHYGNVVDDRVRVHLDPTCGSASAHIDWPGGVTSTVALTLGATTDALEPVRPGAESTATSNPSGSSVRTVTVPAIPIAGEPFELWVYYCESLAPLRCSLDSDPAPSRVEVGARSYPLEPRGLARVATIDPIANAGDVTVGLVDTPMTTTLHIGPSFSRDHSLVTVDNLYVAYPDMAPGGGEPVALTFTISARDDNLRPVTLAPERISLLVGSSPFRPDAVVAAGTDTVVRLRHTSLNDGAIVQLAIDGEPWSAPVTVRRLGASELGRVVSASQSSCMLVEPALAADGQDIGYIFARFEDDSGILVQGLVGSPVVVAEGVTLVDDAPSVTSGTLLVRVRAPSAATRADVSFQWPGQAEPLRCSVPLTPPLPEAEVDVARSTLDRLRTGLSLTDPLPPIIEGEPTSLHWVPRSASDRALGSGLTPTVDAVGGRIVGIDYLGFGEYRIDLVADAAEVSVSVRATPTSEPKTLPLVALPAETNGDGSEDASEDLGPVEPSPEVAEPGPEASDPDPADPNADPHPDAAEAIADSGGTTHDSGCTNAALPTSAWVLLAFVPLITKPRRLRR